VEALQPGVDKLKDGQHPEAAAIQERWAMNRLECEEFPLDLVLFAIPCGQQFSVAVLEGISLLALNIRHDK
jgi:hypothetical protein